MSAEIEVADLQKADAGSYYFIAGCGGPLEKWTEGLEEMLAERGIGKPVAWFQTTGAAVNLYATETKGGRIRENDKFPNDLTCLLFPLDELNVGALAMFKILAEDRWFDDVIANMRTV